MAAVLFEDGELRLRTYAADDLDRLVALANNRQVARYLRNAFPHPYTREDGLAWLAFLQGQPDPPTHWVVEWQGQLAGGISWQWHSDTEERTAELGYWLGEVYWGRGIMVRAIRAVAAHVFAHTPALRLEARVYSPNQASARVMEKTGFVFEGRHRNAVWKWGEAMDLLIYARVREP